MGWDEDGPNGLDGDRHDRAWVEMGTNPREWVGMETSPSVTFYITLHYII